ARRQLHRQRGEILAAVVDDAADGADAVVLVDMKAQMADAGRVLAEHRQRRLDTLDRRREARFGRARQMLARNVIRQLRIGPSELRPWSAAPACWRARYGARASGRFP